MNQKRLEKFTEFVMYVILTCVLLVAVGLTTWFILWLFTG